MKKDQWYKLLGKDLIEGDIPANRLVKNNITEAMDADKVAAKTRFLLLKIADDIAEVTDLLDQNESEEMQKKLTDALPSRTPKANEFFDAFGALDVMAAGKIAKYYRELARNLK